MKLVQQFDCGIGGLLIQQSYIELQFYEEVSKIFC